MRSSAKRQIACAGSIRVVDQDRGFTCEYIVCVDVGDGQVVHPSVLGVLLDRGDRDLGGGGGLQPLAHLQVSSVYPLVGGGDPEGVAAGTEVE